MRTSSTPSSVLARPRGVVLAGLLALGALLPSCNREVSAAKKAPGGPVEVGVMTVTASPVTLTTELPGRTSAVRVAEVRARVNGIVQKRLFTEGSDVKEGQPLFEIDPAPYRATLAGAKAALARAEANRTAARQQASRLEALVASNTASREELERVTATAATAEADVEAARATLTQAKLNLEYTRVTAPIAGRIGRSTVTEGAYVQQSAATLMATIQQLDPVYVDLTQSTAEVLRLRRAMEAAVLQAPGAETKVTLILEDGRAYAEPGTLQFSDVTVDTGTGSISLRAVFPNPRQELLPGMFVRARLDEGINPSALLVPQRAVTRDPKGQAIALVVTAENKVERRTLVTDRAVGNAWLVSQGLAPGDQVILEGLQKVRPGADVIAVPAAPDAPPAQPGTPQPAGGAPAGQQAAGQQPGAAQPAAGEPAATTPAAGTTTPAAPASPGSAASPANR
ncbi:MAG TPA: efflux RND transporter periplasmic adaptor subunit [Nannocystis sp.]|jgi:membrane fusion protein (multidrug efflux system)